MADAAAAAEAETKGTLKFFFKKGAAPAPEVPKFRIHGKTHERYEKTGLKIWALTMDGTLMGHCQDKKCFRKIRAFCPDPDAENSAGKAQRFAAVADAFDAAYAVQDEAAAADALETIKKHRTAICKKCRDRAGQLTPAQKACKDEWERMKWEACVAQDGCANPACTERGAAAWVVLQADHIDPTTKTHPLSDYSWWSWNGGVEAMRAEWTKVRFLCGVCHNLAPTSATGRRAADLDPEALEREEGEANWHFNKRKKRIEICGEKQRFVDGLKIKRGRCEYPDCGRPITRENVQGFTIEHAHQASKPRCLCLKGAECTCEFKLFGKEGGVAGLVHNTAAAARLDAPGVRAALTADVQNNPIWCLNCHVSRKPAKRVRRDATPPACVPCENVVA